MRSDRFSYPRLLFGFCSGWSASFEPDGRYTITARRAVGLVEHPAEFVPAQGTGTVGIPFLVKTEGEGASARGLSSGAGSTLIERDDAVYKIKRNGFLGTRYTHRPFVDSAIHDAPGETLESSTALNYRGVLPPDRARRELEAIRVLREEGLCAAYEPVGLYIYDLPTPLSPRHPPKAGSTLVKVISDVRFDELIFAVLTDYLAEEVGTGALRFEPAEGVFIADNCSVTRFFDLCDRGLSDTFFQLGRSVGSYYREFHRAGHLRGYLNAWFGNEVVNPDGTLSLVDLDFSILRPSCSERDVAYLQRLEYSQARGAFSGEFESMFLHCFATVGYYLGKGFDDGYYGTPGPDPIPVPIITEALGNVERHGRRVLDGGPAA